MDARRGEVLGVTTFRELLGSRNRRATWCRTVLAGALGMVGVVGLAPRAVHATAAPSVAVPAYFWSATQWDRLLVSSAELRYVVMNPESGPGTMSYPTFVTRVAVVRSQGATVVGYVDTNYGARSFAAVKADIDKYRAWYGVNAFFFDQTPYECTQISYYQDIENYVRAQAGGFIFHNPGMNPQECYLGVADVVVNFEGSEASYSGWTPAPYAAGYPANRFWHIVYSVDPTHASALLSTAASRNGGLVFLTEQDMPNPFTVIPTDALWSAQTPTRAGRQPAPQASPPSTTVPAPNATRLAAPQSDLPPTTVPAGPAAEAPVTTRPAAPVAGSATTTTTVVIGAAQDARLPALVEPVPTTLAPSPTVAPTTAVSTIPPGPATSLRLSAPVPVEQRLPASVSDPFPIVPPAPIGPLAAVAELSTVTPRAETPPSPGSKVISFVTVRTTPSTARPPAGPALLASLPTLSKVGIRTIATRATPTRRIAEVPKKPAVAVHRSIR